MPKHAIVTGSAGFIGQALVRRLKSEGYSVHGFDVKPFEFGQDASDFAVKQDLREPFRLWDVDEVYALAANMGGAGHVFTGEHDAEILADNVKINLNTIEACRKVRVGKVFFASSACVYPEISQAEDPARSISVPCKEDHVAKGQPDSPYGLEKLFSECLFQSYARNYGMNVKIARFHNVFGPYGTWKGGREKAPAAICRKVAETPANGPLQIWGPGTQTRSFLYIDEAIEGVRRLMESDFGGPVNIGSAESISITALVQMVSNIAGKWPNVTMVRGPMGVYGRNSDNSLIREKLSWAPSAPLEDGLRKTYEWIAEQVRLETEK